MGWIPRIGATLILVFSFSSGLWLFGILSLLYLVFSFRPRTKCTQGATKAKSRLPIRPILGVGLFVLSVIAVGAGGTYSPILLFFAGLIAFCWSHLPIGSIFAQVVPIEGSILLRSK